MIMYILLCSLGVWSGMLVTKMQKKHPMPNGVNKDSTKEVRL